MKISENIKYVGVNDKSVDLFEGQYKVPNGMSYNSYVIIDEKTAVLDTVDAHFADEWLCNIKNALGGRKPDYLVSHHMEPDHSANIMKFKNEYPDTAVVATAKAFVMMKQFFGTDFAENRAVVGEGDTLALGEHTLTFVTAPMVHWPEVAVSYESKEKMLFSADAFGKFGALDADEEWIDEARRYYIGIVGKYGKQVQALLKKAGGLDIKKICPLHGPILEENLGYYLDLYDKWSSYTAEEDGVVVAYASVYGNTKVAAEKLAEKCRKNGMKNIAVYDLARCDMSAAVADAFRYTKTVLASVTYNSDVFPPMRRFIEALCERGYQNRTVALVENGSWAPTAANVMKKMLENSKDITFAENNVKILSSVNADTEIALDRLAAELQD